MPMDRKMEHTSKLKKLVTLCSTNNHNDGFAALYPKFTYRGNSRSENSSVEVSIPAYKENLVFYEHFGHEDDLHPDRLSFMCLGGDDHGEIPYYNFERYTQVLAVEVFEKFGSVNAVFQTISKLPQCKEVRIFLSNENILPAKGETLMVDRLIVTTKDIMNKHPYLSTSVKTLTIHQVGEIDEKIFFNGGAVTVTRLELILRYALQLFPNLESLFVENLDANGQTYDMLSTFCATKGLIKHNVSIKGGKAFCSPAIVTPAPVQQAVNLPYKSPNPFTSGNVPGIGERFVPATASISSSSPHINTHDPRIAKRVKLEDQNYVPNGVNMPAPPSSQETADIVVLPVPVKEEPEVINISDEETEKDSNKGSSATDKAEIKNMVSRVLLPSPPASTSSLKSSFSTCSTLPDKMDAESTTFKVGSVSSNSLLHIGSSYNDWESDEEMKTTTPVQDVAPVPVKKPLDDYTAEELKKILDVATKGSNTVKNMVNPTKNKRSGRRGKLEQLEGVYFERRTRR